ncbi:recombinase family protein [Micromonosporaceae bacterium Da 78-11]
MGYGQVSTRDQNPHAQHDALTAAACEQIFIDKASGKLTRRLELDKALLVAHRCDDQLVITKLDRLGRSIEHLIELAAQLHERGSRPGRARSEHRHLDRRWVGCSSKFWARSPSSITP